MKPTIHFAMVESTQTVNNAPNLADKYGGVVLVLGLLVAAYFALKIYIKYDYKRCSQRRQDTADTFSEHEIYHD